MGNRQWLTHAGRFSRGERRVAAPETDRHKGLRGVARVPQPHLALVAGEGNLVSMRAEAWFSGVIRMTDDTKPVPPETLGDRGSALWVDLNRDLEFDDHELVLLLETCRTVDVIDELAKVVDRDGVLSSGSTGQTVVHPAVPELRQQQAALTRLVTALNLSEAVTGTHGAVGAARAISSQAQAAANARWSRSKRARGA